MELTATVVYDRGDLNDTDVPFEDVGIEHMRYSMEPVKKAGIAMFVDDDGKTKILKNRFGDRI